MQHANSLYTFPTSLTFIYKDTYEKWSMQDDLDFKKRDISFFADFNQAKIIDIVKEETIKIYF